MRTSKNQSPNLSDYKSCQYFSENLDNKNSTKTIFKRAFPPIFRQFTLVLHTYFCSLLLSKIPFFLPTILLSVELIGFFYL